MRDFLWDSPLYQELIGEIRAEVRASTRQDLGLAILNIVDARFSTLKELANECVNKLDDISILIRLLGKVGSSRTEQDAKKVLKSYLNEHKERGE